MLNIPKDNLNKIIYAQLNINSIPKKFDSLADTIKDNIDVLMISETKVDDSFPDGPFFFDGFETPFRLNRDTNGGGIMLIIRNHIPIKLASTDDKPIESFYVNLNFQNKKWLLNCSYNPKHSSIESHLPCFYNSIHSLSSKYDNVILLSDFNLCIKDSSMKILCKTYKLQNLIKEQTCLKNPENTTRMDFT